MSQPRKFKVGDRVICPIAPPYSTRTGWGPLGATFLGIPLIVSNFHPLEDWVRVRKEGEASLNAYWFEPQYLDHYPQGSATSGPCTCSHSFLVQGCTCGAVQPYSQRKWL